MIPLPAVHWMCVIFMALIVADTIITVLGIIDLADNLAKFSETVQAYAEKAGDSLQWGTDVFRDKFRDKVQDKVQDWSDSSQDPEQAAASYDQRIPTSAFHGFHQIQQDHRNSARNAASQIIAQ